MIPYWIMFILPSIAAIFPQRSTLPLRQLLLVSLGIFYVLLIGLRSDVGGDWANYLHIYHHSMIVTGLNWAGLDPGYVFLNRLMGSLGLGIYGVNLVCGMFFVSGVIVFASRQPLPWLAIAVVVPYLMVVVAMGYTRQSAALGLVFWGLAILRDGHVRRYAVIIIFAALFHKTALLMLPIGFLAAGSGNRLVNITILVSTGIIFGAVLLQAHFEALWQNYVEIQMVSAGGMIRVLMNVVAAAALFVFWKRWKSEFSDFRLWFWIAVLSIVCLGLVGFASTAVDRVALYFAPLQVVVFSRLPVLIHDTMFRTWAVVIIISYYAVVLWIWLNYAIHAHYWLPYQNVLFQ